MRSEIFIAALAGLVSAAPHPQDIDLDAVASAAAPVIVTPAVAVASQTASVLPVSAQASAAASAVASASSVSSVDKRSFLVVREDAACANATGPVLSSACMAAVIADGITALPESDYNTTSVATTTTTTSNSTVTSSKRSKRDMLAYRHLLDSRDGTCAEQPAGSGPTISPDTPAAFLASQALCDLAEDAATPYGYKQSFSNLQGSTSASNYMGLYTLTSYSPAQCQSYCDQAQGCVAFNIYAERDPTLDANAASCPNPPSTTNLKCTLWGVPITSKTATNTGQWRDSFEVVIAASNGYNKNTAPASITGFTGPTELGGAINAPLDSNGHNTYMGYTYYPFSQSQGYTPETCASACTAQTAYNKAHPASDGSYQSCEFFNSYVLSDDGVALGLYCSMYNETWSASYATNYGQYRGSDDYTVSDSYSYSIKAPTCGAKGYASDAETDATVEFDYTSLSTCFEACEADADCESMAWGDDYCFFFDVQIDQAGFYSSKHSLYTFYDDVCTLPSW